MESRKEGQRWWEQDPIAQRIIAEGGRPPSKEPQEVPILPPLEPVDDGPGLSDLLIEDRRRGRR